MTTQKNLRIEARGISKSYSSLVALNNLSFCLKPGECAVFVGPNGAGKTTLCEILEGLQKPDQGSVLINGMSYQGHRKQILENIGVLSQDTALYKKYTVQETLELFASFYSRDIDLALLVRKLELESYLSKRLEELSGGQKQHVYLACSVVHEPNLLFFDEPTTGLDPNARRKIWGLVEAMKKSNRSVLLTTHYMEEAERLGDTIFFLDKGNIMASGSAKALIRKYCSKNIISFYVSERVARNLRLHSSLPKWFPEEQLGSQYVEFSVSDSTKELQKIIHFFSEEKMELTSLSVRKSTLDDVFIKLTGRSSHVH